MTDPPIPHHKTQAGQTHNTNSTAAPTAPLQTPTNFPCDGMAATTATVGAAAEVAATPTSFPGPPLFVEPATAAAVLYRQQQKLQEHEHHQQKHHHHQHHEHHHHRQPDPASCHLHTSASHPDAQLASSQPDHPSTQVQAQAHTQQLPIDIQKQQQRLQKLQQVQQQQQQHLHMEEQTKRTLPHPQSLPETAQTPYYLQDPATMTAVGLQQMQLQIQYQLQASHQQGPTQFQPPPLPLPPCMPGEVVPDSLSNATGLPPASTGSKNGTPSTKPPQNPPGMNTPLGNTPTEEASMTIAESQMASAYRIGRYTPAERRIRLERYREKRATRNYNRRVKYDCRKTIAEKRKRVQGRFVKREEEVAIARQVGRREADGTADGTADDGTEDETKFNGRQPESSGSGSSSRRGEFGKGQKGMNGLSGLRDSFSDQSDRVTSNPHTG